MIRVAYVTSGLGGGGAEHALLRLVDGIDKRRFDPYVVSFTAGGTLASAVRERVPLYEMGMRRGRPSLRGLRRLRQLLGSADVVQTWMYHADLLGGLAAWPTGGPPVIWGVRHGGTLRSGKNSWATRSTVRACALLSRFLPERIVCCGDATRRAHVALGYDPSRMVTITNGFLEDASSVAVRAVVRRELGLPPDAFVVGLVARVHPVKDHSMFFRAVSGLLASVPKTRVVLCGEGTEEGGALDDPVRDTGHGEAFLRLGHRTDCRRLMRSFDVACSSSLAEGMPNALGEAMLAAVPCAATRVGDTENLVGATGRLVAPGDAAALAGVLDDLHAMGVEGRRQLGRDARARVRQLFSLSRAVNRYEELYASVLEKVGG